MMSGKKKAAWGKRLLDGKNMWVCFLGGKPRYVVRFKDSDLTPFATTRWAYAQG